MSWFRRQLRAFSVTGLLLWLVAFELGPSLHIGLHAFIAPHHHEGELPRAHFGPPVAASGEGRDAAGGSSVPHGLQEHRHRRGLPGEREHTPMHTHARRHRATRASVTPHTHAPAAPEAPLDSGQALARSLQHGKHSLAHRGLAVPSAFVWRWCPPVVRVTPHPAPPLVSTSLPGSSLRVVRARGPPPVALV